MKLFLLILYFIVHIALPTHGDVTDNLLIDEEYDDSMFFMNANGVTPLQKRTRLKCLGHGNSILEAFFKKEANGTNALGTTFYSSSKQKPERLALYHGDRFSLNGTDFDIRRRTVFIVHGYFCNSSEKWVKDMETAFLQWDDVNVFVVDWGIWWNYLKAAVNTMTVGDQIATFISQIIQHTMESGYSNPNEWGKLHLVGHSLGAHICGHVSHMLKLRENVWPVWRITGLDPAEPCFRYSDLTLRLDQGDAEFVDVIHTNAKMLKKYGVGLPYPIGHIDFYPNGGGIQPGCLWTSSIWKYLPIPVEKVMTIICSHGRSQAYFTESILSEVEKNCTFWAYEWNLSYAGIEKLLSIDCQTTSEKKCIEMGINAEKYDDRGIYFALTGSSPPHCNIDEESKEEIFKNMENEGKHIFDVI